MSKYIFVVPPFFGHINPTLGIGSELINRGHEVTWVGLKKIEANFIPFKGRFIVPAEVEAQSKEIERICSIQDKGADYRGIDILRFAMEETYIPFCNIMMEGLLRTIDVVKPDLLIHDENMFAGAICATLKNIPYVTSIAVPPGSFQPNGLFPEFEQWQTKKILELQRTAGITGKKKIVYSDILNLVYTSKELVGYQDNFESHYHFVGPIIKGRPKMAEFDFDKLLKKDTPIIYISLGTLLNDIRKAFFRKIIQALANLPLTIVVATEPDVLDSWPDNFVVQRYVPQAKLLSYVDAIIYHGGFNTVNEALYNGVPMLLIPMAYDQFHIASLVVSSGCGLSLRYKRLTPEMIKSSLYELIKDPKYKQAAKIMGNTLKTAGGTDTSADLLEKVLVNT